MASATDRSLASNELFEGLSEEEIQSIEAQCRWTRYAAHEQIFDRDSDNRDVFLVASGQVRVVNFSATGREIAYASVAAGSYFGELAAIDGKRRSATVVAVNDCLIASMAPALFIRLLEQHPSVSLRVLQRLAGIVRTCDDRIMDLSTLRAVQRVYLEILRLTDRDRAVPSLWVVSPMLSHSEIASRASTTRETVARVLGHLSSEGVVQRKNKTLYIRDKGKLEALAEVVSTAEEKQILAR